MLPPNVNRAQRDVMCVRTKILVSRAIFTAIYNPIIPVETVVTPFGDVCRVPMLMSVASAMI